MLRRLARPARVVDREEADKEVARVEADTREVERRPEHHDIPCLLDPMWHSALQRTGKAWRNGVQAHAQDVMQGKQIELHACVILALEL